jgi:hypothetical protein
MRIGMEMVTTLVYMQRIVKKRGECTVGSGINGSYIDQLTFLLINVINRSEPVKLGCHYLSL